jgi:hypothetical protein
VLLLPLLLPLLLLLFVEQVCSEVDRFSADLQHLDGLDFEREMNCDFVLAARLQLSK